MSTTNEIPSMAGAMAQVVGQGERVQGMVEECADDLSSLNAVLQKELAGQDPLPAAEQALEQSEAVEGKVQEASDELSAMNRAMKVEVCERQEIEKQLETANEQGEAARVGYFARPPEDRSEIRRRRVLKVPPIWARSRSDD